MRKIRGLTRFCRRLGIFFMLGFLLLIGNYQPVYASAASVEELYRTSQNIETLLQKDTDLLAVKQQVDRLLALFVKLDLSKTKQSIEGIQALSSELVGLKIQFSSIQLPDKQLVWERMQRLKLGFEALAYPQTAHWRSLARDMIKESDLMEQAIERREPRAAYQHFRFLVEKQREIGIALLLVADPYQVTLLQSAVAFFEQQLSNDVKSLELIPQPLRQYRSTLHQILHKPVATAPLPNKKETPKIDSQSWWIAAVLVASSAYLIYRRLRTY